MIPQIIQAPVLLCCTVLFCFATVETRHNDRRCRDTKPGFDLFVADALLTMSVHSATRTRIPMNSLDVQRTWVPWRRRPQAAAAEDSTLNMGPMEGNQANYIHIDNMHHHARI